MHDTTTTSIRLPKDLLALIREVAKKQDRSVNYIIVSTLKREIKK